MWPVDRSSLRTGPWPTWTALAVVALAVAVVGAGCTGAGPSSAQNPTTAPTGLTAATAASGAAASHRATSPSPASSPPTTTQTAWGRIWDDLPATFPTFPGAEPADTGAGPASAILTVPARTAVVVDWYRAALKTAGYEIEALGGPLEDGSTVIDAVGSDPSCRVQASIVPRGGTSTATILFAAACPFR